MQFCYCAAECTPTTKYSGTRYRTGAPRNAGRKGEVPRLATTLRARRAGAALAVRGVALQIHSPRRARPTSYAEPHPSISSPPSLFGSALDLRERGLEKSRCGVPLESAKCFFSTVNGSQHTAVIMDFVSNTNDDWRYPASIFKKNTYIQKVSLELKIVLIIFLKT